MSSRPHESVDKSSTAQLMVFVRMVFSDFSVREEMPILLPLKNTTKAIDIYEAVKRCFTEINIPLHKLVLVTTDGAAAMTGRHSGFIERCRGDPDFPHLVSYQCIIHQQAICAKVMGFDHVMMNSKQRPRQGHTTPGIQLLLEELSTEYGDLLLHTEIRWLSRGRVLQRFFSLLGEILCGNLIN